jgi:hypothetical protein
MSIKFEAKPISEESLETLIIALLNFNPELEMEIGKVAIRVWAFQLGFSAVSDKRKLAEFYDSMSASTVLSLYFGCKLVPIEKIAGLVMKHAPGDI